MLADFQLYKKAWTASDVKYDWENPDKDVFDDEGRAEVLGPELVDLTNTTPDSDWEVIDGNAAVFSGSSSAVSYLTDVTPTLVDGRDYLISFTISNFSGSGTVGFSNSGLVTGNIQRLNEDGTVSVMNKSTGGALMVFGRDSNSATISNISVKEVIKHKAEILPTDCKALYRLNEGAGDRVYNAAPVLGVEMVSNGDFSEIGEELVDNGDFELGDNGDWTSDASTVFAEGSVTLTGVGIYKYLLSQTNVLESGKLYKVTYTCDLSSVISGSLKFQPFSDDSVSRTVLDGTNTIYLTANGTSFKFSEGGMSGTATLSNISIKEVGQGWTTGTGWSISGGSANASSSSAELSQSGIDFDASKSYRVKYTISGYSGSGGVRPRLKGAVWNNGVLREGNGTFTETLICTAENTIFTLVTSSSFTGSISNISVKEISLSGSHAYAGDPGWVTAQPYIPQYAMSSYSKKALFDGAQDEYVDCGTSLNDTLDDGFTVSCWFSVNTFEDYKSLFDLRNNTGPEEGFEFRMMADSTMEAFFDWGSSIGIQTPTLDVGQLYHVVATIDKSTSTGFKLYLNGVLIGEEDISNADGVDTTCDNALTFMKDFDGFGDEISVFKKVLSATEVQELFNAGMALDARDHSAYLGSEVVADGGFDTDVAESTSGTHWITQAGWTIGSGSATYDGGGDSNTKLQTVTNPSFIDSKIHELVFDLTDTGGGGVYVRLCAGGWSPKITGTGTKTVYLTAGTGTNRLEFETGHDDKAFAIDNVSVKEVQLNGYWRNNGIDTWTDLSLYGNDGTVNGSPTTIQLQEVPYFKKDTFGLPMNKVRERALNLDGDSYAEIDDDSSLDFGTGDFSIEAWVKAGYTSGGSVYNTICSLGGSVTGTDTAAIVSTSSYFRFLCGGDNSSLVIDTTSYTEGEWYHLVAVRSDGITGFYMNTVAQVGGDTNSTDVSNSNDVRVGGDSGNNRYYQELIDDVRIYNRALSDKEIKRNFKASKSKHKNNVVSNWSDDFTDDFI